jgi:hypothetical protein
VYAPGAHRSLLPCCVLPHAGQTHPALFFSLHLGSQTLVWLHFRSATPRVARCSAAMHVGANVNMHGQEKGPMNMGTHHSKAAVVVTVVGGVPVAVSHAGVLMVVVPRAAPQPSGWPDGFAPNTA